MLGNVNWPVSSVKFALRKCRNSPPNWKLWLPLDSVAVSEPTRVVSVRPCGKFDGPPKLSPGPLTVICGSPMAVVTPSRIPRSAGFTFRFGSNVMLIRLKPKRASFTRRWLKTCVSLTVPICRCEWRVSPNPGIVLSAWTIASRRGT